MKLPRFSFLSVVVDGVEETMGPRLTPRLREDPESGLRVWLESKLPPKRPRKGLRVLLSLLGMWGGGGSTARCTAEVDCERGEGVTVL